jgi:oxygen-independent coproporphyrinogen-3 oxidase
LKNLSIYIHWPFCLSKCPYCDFNSSAASKIDHEAWREAFRREIGFYGELLKDRQIATIFFGGGTPSLMEEKTVGTILDEIAKQWPFAEGAEISLEANPSSAEARKFKTFRALGINRLSLGVQSFDNTALKFLGRAHDAATACRAIEAAASVFPRFSFDLIYAYAGQTEKAWRDEIERALSFKPKHLSCYQLTLEEGTVFSKRKDRKKLIWPTEEAALLYETTNDILAATGLPSYEVSNYAAVGEECRHNLVYWNYEDYIGLGPGAHGRFVLDGQRWATADLRSPDLWLARVLEKGEGRDSLENLSGDQAKEEALLMGLRLTEGINLAAWREKFGEDFEKFIAPEKIKSLVLSGFLQRTENHLAATPGGRLRLNAVIEKMI